MHHPVDLTIEHIDGRREIVPPAELVELPQAAAPPEAAESHLPAIHSDSKPYWSYSMGCGPAAARMGQGLPGEIYNRDGALLVRGRAHERAVMHDLGMRHRRSYG